MYQTEFCPPAGSLIVDRLEIGCLSRKMLGFQPEVVLVVLLQEWSQAADQLEIGCLSQKVLLFNLEVVLVVLLPEYTGQ